MTNKSERLAVLSEAEQEALYGLPDFDEAQQLEYLAMSEAELALASSRPGLHAQVHCILQIGYFRAKHAFFVFAWNEVADDCAFVTSRYFQDQAVALYSVSKHERYTQREHITALFGYRPWSSTWLPWAESRALQLVRRDVTPSFVALELITVLGGEHKVIRPGYTTVQEIVSKALADERRRLGTLLDRLMDDSLKTGLEQLLVHENTLSELAVLKQDAKNFGWKHMSREREKRDTLAPLHHAAKVLLPRLEISQQNLLYYASLVNYYTVFDLRRLKSEQTWLYLLCFSWLRYRQFTDNLVAAMGHLMRHYEGETKARAQKRTLDEHAKQQQDSRKVGRLLLLYVDDKVDDSELFGEVRRRAYQIMDKEAVQAVGERLSAKQLSSLALRWDAIDSLGVRVRLNLRPIFTALKFHSATPDNPWLNALEWVKTVFARQQRLSQCPLLECPPETLPQRLRTFLLNVDGTGNPVAVNDGRYEFWLYHQLVKRLRTGDIFIDDSLQHRRLADELVALADHAPLLAQMKIAWLSQPIGPWLAARATELRRQWRSFNSELRRGKLPHLAFDPVRKRVVWNRPKAQDSADQCDGFYGRLPLTDVADVLRYVNAQCQFLSALTPLQPRYVKQDAEIGNLLAVIMAQAMNYGIRVMARTSDISHRVLENTYRQYLRQSTLQAANDCISNAIAKLPIFEHFSFDLEVLYASLDGQKFSMERPSIQARHSRKYFGRGKGVVAYTLLCNHVPLQGWVIGAHEFEAHHAFDIWYRNTSDILPTAVTGDMHSINRANFAIFDWFGVTFAPRFTDANAEIKELYCADDLALYEKYLIKPAGCINLRSIEDEKTGIDQIVATLGLKEMTQATLIRKICTYSPSNPARRAVFEYDKLIRSIYTLRYLRNPQLQRDVNRSQNRIESYHQLRAAIAQVGGKKELTGQTDIGLEISNQCARLVANAIIYYNSAILSRLLRKYEKSGNTKALALIKSTSPVAWQHLLMGGHYTFESGKVLDLDALLDGLDLE